MISSCCRLFVSCIFLLGLCSGCVVESSIGAKNQVQYEPTVIFRSDASSYILSCLNEVKGVRVKEFDRYFSRSLARADSGREEDRLRLVCLGLSSKADYKQFRKAMAVLDRIVKEHPDDSRSLEGLRYLVHRLDQVTIDRWSVEKKLLGKQEDLETELAQLQTEIITLRQQCEQEKEELNKMRQQDALRIKELHHQIEQLKNIENIIKNREHGS